MAINNGHRVSKAEERFLIPSSRRGPSAALRALNSILISRDMLQGFEGRSFSGARDIYKVCGYDQNLTFDHYYSKYHRGGIAGRVVDIYPDETWRKNPIIYEDPDEDKITDFEKAMMELEEKLHLFHYLERVDRLSGVGRYGVLLMGVAGGGDLAGPLAEGSLTQDDLIYLKVYMEGSAEIDSFVADNKDSRYGKPEFYKLKVNDAKTQEAKTVKCHWTHVVHIAENCEEDDVYGRPRLQRIYNLLYDLEKLVGGSAEMFWQGARLGLHVNVNPEYQMGDLAGDIDDEFTKLQDELDEYFHGLRRFIRTRGVDIDNLGTQYESPKEGFETIINEMCGTTGIPQRIMLGAERGELASTLDEANWISRIAERQHSYAEPSILRPFIRHLQWLGVLPETPKGYKVEWPNLFEMSDKDKSDIAVKKSTALRNYAPITPELVVPPDEFRNWVGLDPLTEAQKKEMFSTSAPRIGGNPPPEITVPTQTPIGGGATAPARTPGVTGRR